MPNIFVNEETFSALADAAHIAKERGNIPLAVKLDRLARMASAALSNQRARDLPGSRMMGVRRSLTWKDVPSVFDL